LKYIAKEMNVKLQLVTVIWANRMNYILTNKVDITAASKIHKISRGIKNDFTITYFYDGESMLANFFL